MLGECGTSGTGGVGKGHYDSLAQATVIHSINNCVALGDHCKGVDMLIEAAELLGSQQCLQVLWPETWQMIVFARAGGVCSLGSTVLAAYAYVMAEDGCNHICRYGGKSRQQRAFSCVQLFATPWTVTHQASLSLSNSQSLLKFMSIESLMPFNHLILLSPFPPALNLSQHQGIFQ